MPADRPTGPWASQDVPLPEQVGQTERVEKPTTSSTDAPVGRSRQLARLMDDVVTVPGTQIGVGLDSVIGLVPGVGDLAGSAISGVIIYDAIQHRVPVRILARMGRNVLVDAGLGLVPVAGDLMDVAHRANRKNYRLLEQAVEDNPGGGKPSTGYLIAAVTVVVLPLIAAIVIGFVLLVLLLRAVF